ncbi:MAG: galactokinase [Bradyrhizobium sp.]|nr:MAG: galactokinase [Bradyrhizobium sp.]
MGARDALIERFRNIFGGEARLYRAPGRVNLIGEHTDYNGGFVLPAALEQCTWIAAAPRPERRLRAHSLREKTTLEFDLDDPAPTPRHDWSDYVRGVAVMLQRDNQAIGGADLVIDSDVPIGSGLSSSAALEVATGFALLDLAHLPEDRTRLALSCQRAENEFVGMRCGVMDQFASCHGAADRALLIDCRSLEFRLTPIDPSVRLVICNSMVHHELAGSQYNVRRAQCEEAVARLSAVLPGVRELRDVTMDDLTRHGGLLSEVVLRRARHIVTENERVVRAADALAAGEVETCGRLMRESHVSMRDDYEISCKEIDILVDLASKIPGVLGARMTGGGFGGCTINLVRVDAVERFGAEIAESYKAATGITAPLLVCRPGAGAGVAN